MSRHYFIATAVLLGLVAASCSKNDVSENTSPENAIGFGTYSLQSKANTGLFVDGTTNPNIPNGKAIGVYGYVHDNTTWTATYATAAPNIFNNVAVTATSTDGTTFSYSPSRYWPSNTTTLISFYAYYPQNGTGITPTVTTGMGSYAFETQALAANQVDFLVSDLEANQSKTNGNPSDGSVDLKFHHMLCQIKASVTPASEISSNPGYVGYSITSIKVKNVYSTGTLTPTSNGTTTSFGWDNLGGNTTSEFDMNNGTGNENILLLIPQTIPSGATIEVNYTLTFNYSGNVSESRDKTKDIVYAGNVKNATLTGAWDINKIYNYTISVSLDHITFSSTVTDWETGSTVTL
jgi:hypothetical protein